MTPDEHRRLGEALLDVARRGIQSALQASTRREPFGDFLRARTAEVRATVEQMPDPPLSDLVDHVYADPPATLAAQWRQLEEFEAQFEAEA